MCAPKLCSSVVPEQQYQKYRSIGKSLKVETCHEFIVTTCLIFVNLLPSPPGFFTRVFFAPKGGCFRGKLKTSGSGRRKQFAVFSVFRAKSDLENIYVAWFLLRESGFISLSPGAKRPSFMCDLFWTWCAQSGAKIDLLTKWTINTWNVLNQAFLPFLFEWNFWLILLKGFASRGQKITMRELLFQKLCFILH